MVVFNLCFFAEAVIGSSSASVILVLVLLWPGVGLGKGWRAWDAGRLTADDGVVVDVVVAVVVVDVVVDGVALTASCCG